MAILGAIRGRRKRQVRCQGESTYTLEEDIEECFRTGRGLAVALGGPGRLRANGLLVHPLTTECARECTSPDEQ